MGTEVKRMIMVIMIIGMIIIPPTLGGRLAYSNGAMDADPTTLTIFILGTLILFSIKRENLPLEKPEFQTVGRGTRFLAAMFDLYSVMFAYFAAVFPIHLITEWILTGTWQWSWDSHRYWFMNVLGFISVFFGFWVIYQYFWLHLKTGRTTIGQYIMGFRIIKLEGSEPRRRLHGGIFALWLWPIFMFAGKRSEGVYSWDENSKTLAVSTRKTLPAKPLVE